MTNPNADLIAAWNGPGVTRWIRSRARLDRALSPLTESLFAAAAPRAGERGLDIGCGCGTTSIELHARTGATVVGIDVSAPLLAVARDGAPAAVRFVEADASCYAFAPEFELAVSRIGLMFFVDPVAAFANIRTALVPGGRIAFACWQAVEHNAWAAVPATVAREHWPPRAAAPHAPGPFALADPERVRGILSSAGFRAIRITPLELPMWMGATLDDAVEAELEDSYLLDDGDAELNARLRASMRRELERYVTETGVFGPSAAWVVVAEN